MGRVSPAERDAILLDYECAYIAANGFEPNLQLLSNGRYVISALDLPDSNFAIYEFPHMASNLWERAEQQHLENRTNSISALFKRLAPVNIREVIANEIQTSSRG